MTKDDKTREELRAHEVECGQRYKELWTEVNEFKLSMVKKFAELKGQVKMNSNVTWLILAILIAGLAKDFLA